MLKILKLHEMEHIHYINLMIYHIGEEFNIKSKKIQILDSIIHFNVGVKLKYPLYLMKYVQKMELNQKIIKINVVRNLQVLH